MCCDAFSNMLEFLLPILEYLSHLLSDFQTVCSIMMNILSLIFLITIAAMSIAEEYENTPS